MPHTRLTQIRYTTPATWMCCGQVCSFQDWNDEFSVARIMLAAYQIAEYCIWEIETSNEPWSGSWKQSQGRCVGPSAKSFQFPDWEGAFQLLAMMKG
jgi:hypothetical protein